jgi:glycerate 2-kinase
MTKRTAEELRTDALAIWHAAVQAVDSRRLLHEHVRVAVDTLWLGDHALHLPEIGRIAIVGAGKAGAGMAAGCVEALGEQVCRDKQVGGWVNVPDDCARPVPRVHLHAARPAGVNEPTQRGVAGADRILQIVQQLGRDDVCLCLLSGGGSALLPAPVNEVPLEEKLQLTRHLSAAGANIQQLNTVRKQLSRIKGGRLAAACRAGRLFVLVISDVIGDPLDVIASGPATPDSSTPGDALAVLQSFDVLGVAPRAVAYLRSIADQPAAAVTQAAVQHLVIGNNAVAVDAAGAEAERRGYRHAMIGAKELEGPAEDVGRHHAHMALHMRDSAGPDCLISGGEPIVRLAPAAARGKGGRNQQLVLAALQHLLSSSQPPVGRDMVILSGGTDGEDGPTDAAGAWIDEDVARRAAECRLDIDDYLQRNDAYHFFEAAQGLIRTGATHTNVCDVRVVLVNPAAA